MSYDAVSGSFRQSKAHIRRGCLFPKHYKVRLRKGLKLNFRISEGLVLKITVNKDFPLSIDYKLEVLDDLLGDNYVRYSVILQASRKKISHSQFGSKPQTEVLSSPAIPQLQQEPRAPILRSQRYYAWKSIAPPEFPFPLDHYNAFSVRYADAESSCSSKYANWPSVRRDGAAGVFARGAGGSRRSAIPVNDRWKWKERRGIHGERARSTGRPCV